MLSRVAESIYWIGRYVERAENTARLLDVSLRSSRELATSYRPGAEIASEVTLLLRAVGEEEAYNSRYGAVTDDGLASFLVTDQENRSSVVSCLTVARNSARGVRESISSEMWEELNRAYLNFQRTTSAYLLMEGLHDFCRQIRLASQLFQGVTDATMPRDEGWHFLLAGKYLERAGMTARILDARLTGVDLEVEQPPEEIHRWLALLRSVSGYEAYMRLVPGGMRPAAVAEFLLNNVDFPRSVAFGVHRVQDELIAINRKLGGRRKDGPAGRAAALRLQLEAHVPDNASQSGLAGYIGGVIDDCGAIGDLIRRKYFENAAITPSAP